MEKKIDEKNRAVIGVLAGMGPRSTAPFVNLIIDECQRQYGAKEDIDFPHMIIYSLPTPFYVNKPIDHSKMKRVISQGLKKLEANKVDFIVMPCNTAHIYFDYLKTYISVPLLNIVDETLKEVRGNKITLLGTEPTFNSNIYQQDIKKKGLAFIFKAGWQKKVNKIIRLIKLGKKPNADWKRILLDIKKENIDTVILACTELNVLDQNFKEIRFIDSSKVLAKATIRRYLEK